MSGPQGAGKTHLANVWRARSGADAFAGAPMCEGRSIARCGDGGSVVIEDIDTAPVDEHAAFHLLNLARERRFDVLITARTPPGQWRIALPDLRSRLQLGRARDDRGAGRGADRRGDGEAVRRPAAQRRARRHRLCACGAWSARWRPRKGSSRRSTGRRSPSAGAVTRALTAKLLAGEGDGDTDDEADREL